MSTSASSFPSADDFFLSIPLYDEYAIDPTNPQGILDLEYFDDCIDTYCLECRSDSVFRTPAKGQGFHTVEDLLSDRVFAQQFSCVRSQEHKVLFFFRVVNGKVSKIGQSPSLADMVIPELQPYRALLGDKYGELARALGLVSHGIGIGAFVYLRRVLEFLVESAHKEAGKSDGFDEVSYRAARFDERAKMLREHLPPFLVENAHLYGILSKGVHELSEEECLEYFPAVRAAVELILDQRLEEMNRQRKMDVARKALTSLGVLPKQKPKIERGSAKPVRDPTRAVTKHGVKGPVDYSGQAGGPRSS